MPSQTYSSSHNGEPCLDGEWALCQTEWEFAWSKEGETTCANVTAMPGWGSENKDLSQRRAPRKAGHS